MSDVQTGTWARPGMANKANATDALFLEIFSGQVLNFFNNATVTMGRHTVRSISEGKQANFPVTGVATAAYHSPGNELSFSSIEHAERTISIDGLLISSVFIPLLEEAMNHFDLRTEYAKQVGSSIAERMDADVLRNMVLAARSSSSLTAEPDSAAAANRGEIITGSSADEILADYEKLVTCFYAAAQKLDEKNVGSAGRQAFLKPVSYYSLFRSTAGTNPVSDMINRDLGGTGSLANVVMPKIAGFDIVKTNLLPDSDESGNIPTALDQNYAKTVAVLNTSDAVGTVKLIDMVTESQYDLRRQGHILLSKIACGHGPLRPEASIEINDSGSSVAGAVGFHADEADGVTAAV